MKSPHPTRMTVLEEGQNKNRFWSRSCLILASLVLMGAVYNGLEHDSNSAALFAGAALAAGGVALFREMRASVYEAELLAYGRPNHPGQPRTGAAG